MQKMFYIEHTIKQFKAFWKTVKQLSGITKSKKKPSCSWMMAQTSPSCYSEKAEALNFFS